jgi:hypothetical protein
LRRCITPGPQLHEVRFALRSCPHGCDPPITKNVTITLDERTAAWVRVCAARHNTSVSRIVGEMPEQRMGELREYDAAMRRFLG